VRIIRADGFIHKIADHTPNPDRSYAQREKEKPLNNDPRPCTDFPTGSRDEAITKTYDAGNREKDVHLSGSSEGAALPCQPGAPQVVNPETHASTSARPQAPGLADRLKISKKQQ
jgi:hypothetical protein